MNPQTISSRSGAASKAVAALIREDQEVAGTAHF
jgi:hypothetical protein